MPVNEEAPNRLADRVQRGQWLRAAILGANDGLLSTTSLMLGIGAAKKDRQSMVLSGLAGAVAGACSMAVGEFVSVSTQRDIEKMANQRGNKQMEEILPNPFKAAVASGFAFLLGSLVPLLSAAFVRTYRTRILMLPLVTSIALAAFGGVGASLGGSPVRVSALRVLIGGWIAMAITYGLLKPLQDHDD
ncbi:vacuolar iron transporter homolog 4-like [Aristolochia californica]|uniref:vacuolar iron transporter homolog 4-like n=1 Tax=Aristolochia californica TaxID=171875 RepID=UPI0035DC42A0